MVLKFFYINNQLAQQVKLDKTVYRDVINNENAMYCEIKYNRDRSSFAGIVFEITNKHEITNSNFREIIFEQVNKYEKIYIGMQEDYYKSFAEVYNRKKYNIGIHIYFLVYSDVQSSQIIFEKLMDVLWDNISDKQKK